LLKSFRGIRIKALLIAVAVCAGVLGVGVHLDRAWSLVRHWTLESRPGNPSRTRMQAVLNLRYHVPRSEREEAFPVLLAAAKDSDPLVRASAARALAGRTDRFAEVLPILRDLMKDPVPEVRESAILELESFVKPDSKEVSALVPELVAALDDPKPPVRLEAARALKIYGRLGVDAQHIMPAMARLIREETGTYRLDALYYLNMNQMVPKDLEPTLRGLLKANIPNERIQAKLALILLGLSDEEHDAMIKSMLESPELNERLVVSDFLIQLGMRETGIRALKDLARSDDSAIRDLAEKLLRTHDRGDEDL
jgi:HEAT repeat protein